MKDDSKCAFYAIYDVTHFEGPIAVTAIVVITIPPGDNEFSQASRNSALLAAEQAASDILGTTYVDLLAYNRVSLVRVSTIEDIPYIEE